MAPALLLPPRRSASHCCGRFIRPVTALNTSINQAEILLVWRKSARIEQLVESCLATIARGFKVEAGEFKNRRFRSGPRSITCQEAPGRNAAAASSAWSCKRRQRWNRLCSLLSSRLFGVVVRCHRYFSGRHEDNQFPRLDLMAPEKHFVMIGIFGAGGAALFAKGLVFDSPRSDPVCH